MRWQETQTAQADHGGVPVESRNARQLESKPAEARHAHGDRHQRCLPAVTVSPASTLQQAADLCQILRRQLPRSLLQPQSRKYRIVHRLGEVGAGLEELGLGIQYVEVDANPDAVAQLSGFQRQARRGLGGFQGLDLGAP
jgi:hypothetical protein